MGFLVATATVVLVLVLLRGRELFRISVRGGDVLVVRGRVPPGFLTDVRSLVLQQALRRGEIRAVWDGDRARLVCSRAIDEGTAQRLRNTFALYPIAAVRGAPRIANPNLGQILGVAWLAWLLRATHD